MLGSDVQTLFWMEAHCNAYEGKLTDLSKVKLSKDFTDYIRHKSIGHNYVGHNYIGQALQRLHRGRRAAA